MIVLKGYAKEMGCEMKIANRVLVSVLIVAFSSVTGYCQSNKEIDASAKQVLKLSRDYDLRYWQNELDFVKKRLRLLRSGEVVSTEETLLRAISYRESVYRALVGIKSSNYDPTSRQKRVRWQVIDWEYRKPRKDEGITVTYANGNRCYMTYKYRSGDKNYLTKVRIHGHDGLTRGDVIPMKGKAVLYKSSDTAYIVDAIQLESLELTDEEKRMFSLTDVSGRHKTVAKVVSFQPSSVVLERSRDGKTVTVPYDQLSEQSRTMLVEIRDAEKYRVLERSDLN
jgi:hypothetical protein